jgi:DNA-binding beta-propeller fold protein YncE
MIRSAAALILAAATMLGAAAQAQTLYAVSVRTYSDASYKGIESNLYQVAPETGATTLMTSLTYTAGTPVGMEGLAIHPKTGVFYGITAATTGVIPQSLVQVEPESGRVSLIGGLGVAGSDIAFDRDGTLFIWIPVTRQVGTVDLESGVVTRRGRPGERGASKGGFAVIANGVAIVAATGATGTIDMVNLSTGAITTGPQLTDAPFPGLISGLAYSSQGETFAINTDFGTSSSANLVSIDLQTGKVTNVGPLPNDADAMTFGRTIALRGSFTDPELWRFPIMVALFLAAIVFITAMLWPRKKR